MTEFYQTRKQIEIIEKVLGAADKGQHLSITELWKSLSYGPQCTKQAILCSIRILKLHGLVRTVYGKDKIEFKRGREGHIVPTPEAYARFRPTPVM